MRIGLIADTHGLLRNEVYAVFEGVDEIIHAGDVGDPSILGELEIIAPVQAVFGNVDGWDVREAAVEALELEHVLRRGLHETLTWVVDSAAAVADRIHADFFDPTPVAARASAATALQS